MDFPGHTPNPKPENATAGTQASGLKRFRVWGFEFRVLGLGFGVEGLGFRVWGLGLWLRKTQKSQTPCQDPAKDSFSHGAHRPQVRQMAHRKPSNAPVLRFEAVAVRVQTFRDSDVELVNYNTQNGTHTRFGNDPLGPGICFLL